MCARGYQGEFPDCEPCHQCFATWDIVVGELTNQTWRLEAQVTELQTEGVTEPYKEVIGSLERNSKAVREIVESNPAAVKLEQTQDVMHQITYVQKHTETHRQTHDGHTLCITSSSCLQRFDVLPERKAQHHGGDLEPPPQ